MSIGLGSFLDKMVHTMGPSQFPFGTFEVTCTDSRSVHRFDISVMSLGLDGLFWKKDIAQNGNQTPWPFTDMNEYLVRRIYRKKSAMLGQSLVVVVEADE